MHIQGQYRGRAEIVPDQKEKYVQRLQQQQQGHSNILGMPRLVSGNSKPFSGQQQNQLLQQVEFCVFIIHYCSTNIEGG